MEMDQLVALCKRRGFLFQSSEIYGGIQGFWDYGPLGVELKRNVRETWWREMVTGHNDQIVPPGAPSAYQMTGLECTIIMHPQVWKASGHYDLFHDYMVDCRQSKRRYRYDQVEGRWAKVGENRAFIAIEAAGRLGWDRWIGPDGAFIGMAGFGASGPINDLYAHFGITADAACAAARKLARKG